jgi:HD superfamily phosphodiesterase
MTEPEPATEPGNPEQMRERLDAVGEQVDDAKQAAQGLAEHNLIISEADGVEAEDAGKPTTNRVQETEPPGVELP